MPAPSSSSADVWLRRYAEFIARHARAVLVVSVIVTAVVGSGMSRLVLKLDPDQELPPDHPYIIADRAIRKEFGGANFVAIALMPKSGNIWAPDVLRVVSDLTFDLLDAPGVIRQNVLSLSSPYVRVPEERDGVLTNEYLMKDVPADAAAAAALRERYNREPLFKGTVVSNDERAALVLVDFYDQSNAGAIAATVEHAVAKYRSPTMAIAVTGTPIFSNAEAVLINQQGEHFIGTIIAILIVLWLAFGQIQGVILPSATAFLSTILTLGAMGFLGVPINAWTSAVPLIVVTVAAGHSAQMLKRYYEEFARLGDRTAAVVASTQHVGMVMVAAGVTAGCGFGALALLGIPSLSQFGTGVACGIAAAVVLEMTFMLALRVVWPTGRATRGEGPLPRWLGWALRPLEAAVRAHPRRVILGFVALALLALAGLPRLVTEVNTTTYWSERTQAGRDLRLFQQHFPGTTTLTILLDGDPGSMQTPEAMDVMTGLQRAMEEVPGVDRTSSVADIIRRTYEVFAPEEARNGLPADAPLIGQLFFLANSPGFERYVNRAYDRSVVYGFLDREDSALTRAVIARLEAHLAAHPPAPIRVSLAGGGGPTILAVNDHTVKGKLLNILVVFAVIFAIASLLLRTPLGGALVTAPLVMALIVNLGVFSWLRIPFDLSGASVAAVGVGIGADYAIYCLYRLREEFRRTGNIEDALHAMMATTGRAVAFVALAISAGFAVYLFSDFYGFRILGMFVPLTMLISCATALMLPTALVLLLRPRFIFGAAPTNDEGLRMAEPRRTA